MKLLSGLFELSKSNRTLRATVLYPFYLLRFIYASIRENSASFARYYPGYHGSTIPSQRFIQKHREALFDQGINVDGDGIALNEREQRELLLDFANYWQDFAPPATAVQGKLYYYKNSMFGFNDAFILFCFIRHFKPSRILEVGSGFSSALMLDVSGEYAPSTELTFIDPYSTTIQDVLRNRPKGNYRLIREEMQNIQLSEFSKLQHNDILFIDTSHVVKIGSDLTALFFSILPSLRPGVIIHIHDVWHPWEYPEEMLAEGRAYNEIYFVRAFLQFNDAFEIIFFNSHVESRFGEEINEKMPGLSNGRGQSLWLRKVR